MRISDWSSDVCSSDLSAWTDYSAKLISKGGGIFERSAKSIKITPEMKQRFGIAKDSMTPSELIQCLLQAEVELLWFGGIGTYVKASAESHLDVGDRANDALRVDGEQLRAKVIGEGRSEEHTSDLQSLMRLSYA